MIEKPFGRRIALAVALIALSPLVIIEPAIREARRVWRQMDFTGEVRRSFGSWLSCWRKDVFRRK